jgi:hypothetical protein
MKSRRTVKGAWRMAHITEREHIRDVDEAMQRTRREANVSGIKPLSSQHRIAAELAINMGLRWLAAAVGVGDMKNDWEPEVEE